MDQHPLIPFDLEEIYKSCISQVADPEDQKCLDNLAFEITKIDPNLLQVIKGMSEIQSLYVSTEPMILSRNMLMAYVAYRLTRLKMINALKPSLN